MKICIIGKGLTALILAKIITNKKIHVDLYSKKTNLNNYLLRTVAITENNLKFLENFFPKIGKIGNKVDKIKIYRDRDLNKEALTFLSNNRNQFSLFEYVKLFKLISSLTKNRYYKEMSIDNRNNIYSKNFTKNYNLIIDTELKHKLIKNKFKKRIIKNYYSKAYITIIDHSLIKNNVASQIFTTYGPLAFLPIDNKRTSIVFSIKNSAKIDEEKFKKLITFYNKKYNIKNFKNIKYFNLKLSLLRNYIHNNILAFGEQLHRIHPLAGQGLNMSIRDIIILSKLIDKKMDLGYPIDKYLLKEFENKAKYRNIIFATGIDIINSLFYFENKIPDNISKKIFKTIKDSYLIPKFSTVFANKGL